MGNRLKYIVNRLKSKGKTIFLNQTAKHVTLSVAELFFQHNGQENFLRYDMIVRLLAIENYFGKNDYGFDFYKRMQIGRTGKEWAEKAVDIFRNLIKSYAENGYDSDSEILLDRNLRLIDGSHRMALAMYNHILTINAKVINEQHDCFYSIEWFRVNGFSEEECRSMQNKYQELHSHYMQPFVCTLWHPAAPFFDEITEKLKLFGQVVEVKDCQLSEWDYKFYTRGIYSVDDIAKWKIEKKIDCMTAKYSSTYRMRMVALQLECPNFRLKATNHNTLSKKCETIKSVIRTYYKERIDNYIHDIIVHIGDNFYQNCHIYRMFTMPDIDVKGILEHIHECNYVIVKMQVDYVPADFPLHYPLGKDIDIICADEGQYNKVKTQLLQDAEQYKSTYHVRAIKQKDENGQEYRTLLRFEQGEHLVFLFDIQCRIGSATTSAFVPVMCAERIKVDSYYIPSPEFEVMVRLCELYYYPNKQQHIKYVAEHTQDINPTLCELYLKFNWLSIVEKVANISDRQGKIALRFTPPQIIREYELIVTNLNVVA